MSNITATPELFRDRFDSIFRRGILEQEQSKFMRIKLSISNPSKLSMNDIFQMGYLNIYFYFEYVFYLYFEYIF